MKGPVRYGKFLTGKDCREQFSKETSAMVMGKGRWYGRAPFNHIFNKAPKVFRYIPILIDSGGRRMSSILAFQL